MKRKNALESWASSSERSAARPERIIASLYLVTSLFLLVSYLPPSTEERPLVTFYTVRAMLIIVAFVLNIARYSSNYYLPVLSEMAEKQYWQVVIVIAFLTRVPFNGYFYTPDSSPLSWLFHLGFSLFIISYLLYAYQLQLWSQEEHKKRQHRIAQLMRKARFTNEESDLLIPKLVTIAAKNESRPIGWTVLWWLLAVAFSATISSLAELIVDLVTAQLDVNLPNFLPPF